MANALYEETHIRDIADAIREKNGSTEKYTVSQMGDAVRNIPTGEGCDHNLKVYAGEITETVLGSGKYAVLVKDPFLATIKDAEHLFVRVKFEVEATKYTIHQVWAFNTTEEFPYDSNTTYQYVRRYNENVESATSTIAVPVNTTSPASVGCVRITADGELRCYSNSTSNYAIRPCKYTVEVEW